MASTKLKTGADVVVRSVLIVFAKLCPVYSTDPSGVAGVRLPIMVAQPVHCGGVPNIAKLPVPAPMFAVGVNVIDVAVKLSFPFRDSTLPAAMGTALAEVATAISPATIAPPIRPVFMTPSV